MKKRKNNNLILTPNIENVNNNNNGIVSTYENRANVVIGPRNVWQNVLHAQST